jgi:G:T-mismatch repair DNA endonuclease (very short patch repair protein)
MSVLSFAFNIDEVISKYLEGFNVTDLKKEYGFDFRNLFILLGIKRTNKESKKTKQYQEKIKKTCIEKYGVDNPSKNKDIKEKKKQTFMKNQGYENNFCNLEIRKKAFENQDYSNIGEKLKKSMLKKYGVENITNLPEIRKKIGESNRKTWGKKSHSEKLKLTEYSRSCINYVSKLELRVQEILNENNITYTANGFLYGYNFDIIFKNRKVLEIQGDFWHGNPLYYKENDLLLGDLKAGDVWKKDKKKKLKLENNGYLIVYLWESEINNMSKEDLYNCLKKIWQN